jgi:hypothetical protein
MKGSKNLYKIAVLALATAALVGKAALAEDLPQSEANESSSNIVLATAHKQTNENTEAQPAIDGQADESAVTDALASVLADSKNELELRLLDHKSLILTADL